MKNPIRIDLFRSVLEEAGTLIRDGYFASSYGIKNKTDGSPVTEVDTRCNALLQEKLHSLFPIAKWLSEESADSSERLSAEWLWVVDPMDGTREFIRSIPELAISVGLVHQNQVVLGGVFNPITGEGGIASLSGDKNFWGFSKEEKPTQVSLSRSETEAGKTRFLNDNFSTIAVGSIAYKLLRVAAGKEIATVSLEPKSEWDICGGVALVLAAGKVYERLDDIPVAFNQASPVILSSTFAGEKSLVEKLKAAVTDVRQFPPKA